MTSSINMNINMTKNIEMTNININHNRVASERPIKKLLKGFKIDLKGLLVFSPVCCGFKGTSGKHVRAMNTPKSHFYIVKLRYAGVYLFFLFLIQNINCGYSLEPPGGSNVYPKSMF